jgi:hypothetical protein
VLYSASLDEHSVYYLNRQAIEIGQFAIDANSENKTDYSKMLNLSRLNFKFLSIGNFQHFSKNIKPTVNTALGSYRFLNIL